MSEDRRDGGFWVCTKTNRANLRIQGSAPGVINFDLIARTAESLSSAALNKGIYRDIGGDVAACTG